MPFPFHRRSFKSKDHTTTSPEIIKRDNKSQKRPLMFAQDSAQDIISPTTIYEPYIAHAERTPIADVDDDDYDSLAAGHRRDQAQGQDQDQNEDDSDSFIRPQTPPQGSNYNAWLSYRDLPRTHPVFSYPAEVREKMYAKGIGMFASPPKKKAPHLGHPFTDAPPTSLSLSLPSPGRASPMG